MLGEYEYEWMGEWAVHVWRQAGRQPERAAC